MTIPDELFMLVHK